MNGLFYFEGCCVVDLNVWDVLVFIGNFGWLFVFIGIGEKMINCCEFGIIGGCFEFFVGSLNFIGDMV